MERKAPPPEIDTSDDDEFSRPDRFGRALLSLMKKCGVPPTRENYLTLNSGESRLESDLI